MPPVDSQAMYVPGRPALSAKRWHSVSPPSMPPSMPGTTVLEVTNMYACGPNVAEIATALVRGNVHVGSVPRQGPLVQPAKLLPGAAVAISVKLVVAACERSGQLPLQVMDPSSAASVPAWPATPSTVSEMGTMGNVNVAVTERG